VFDVVNNDDMQGTATGWWPVACGMKAEDKVCCL